MDEMPTDLEMSHDIALGYTHIFSSALANDFHYSWLRANQQRLPPLDSLAKDYAGTYGLTPAILGKGFPSLGTLGQSISDGTTGQGGGSADIDQNFIVGDNLTLSKGRHLFQFGADFRWIQSNQYDFSGLYGGKYGFSNVETNTTGKSGGTGGDSWASFILGDINTFSNTPVEVPGYYRWHYQAGYAQDDWRATAKLTLNLGVRYEVETPKMEKFNNQALMLFNVSGTLNGLPTSAEYCFSGQCGLGKTLWPMNYHGIEPRVGISYAATQKTTVRMSYAISRLPLSGYENTPDPDFNVASQSVGNQTGGAVANSTVNYITNPVGTLTSAYTALNGNRGPILDSVGLSPAYVNQSNIVPYAQTYSLSVQYEPKPRLLLQATYQGMKGTHLISGNFALPKNVPTFAQIFTAVQNGVYLSATTPNPYGIIQTGAVINESKLQQLNPYQNFFNVSLAEIYPRYGASEYNAMYLAADEHYLNGLSLLMYYKWSKSEDNIPVNTGIAGDFSAVPVQDPNHPYEWAVSSTDQPSALKAGYSYDLPLGKGKLLHASNGMINELIGNISTSGIVTIASGYPNAAELGSTGYFTSFTPQGSQGCTTAYFCASSALPSGFTLRPNIIPGVPLRNPNWKQNPWGVAGTPTTPYLNPAAFSIPGSLGAPQFGNEPRTLTGVRSPRQMDFDLQVTKGFHFGDRYELKLQGQALDAMNHRNFACASYSHAIYSSVTNVTNATTPSITFNPSTSFGILAGQGLGAGSRYVLLGASLSF